jgi:hypothetical protein
VKRWTRLFVFSEKEKGTDYMNGENKGDVLNLIIKPWSKGAIINQF